GEGGIGKVPGVADAAALLLGDDLVVQFLRHAIEFDDHRLDLRHLAALFVGLEPLQADGTFARLHRSCTPSLRFRPDTAAGHFLISSTGAATAPRKGVAAPVTIRLRLALIMGPERLIRGKSPGRNSVGFPRVL